LARIMRETFHGSDAGGAWDWRMAYDLMQAAAIQVVLRWDGAEGDIAAVKLLASRLLLLDELLKGCERPEDLLGNDGLMKELKIKLMERMLGAELTAHLGYEDGKDAPADQVNRRRGGSGNLNSWDK